MVYLGFHVRDDWASEGTGVRRRKWNEVERSNSLRGTQGVGLFHCIHWHLIVHYGISPVKKKSGRPSHKNSDARDPHH